MKRPFVPALTSSARRSKLRVLARGYAWLADDAGRAVTTVSRLAPGQALHAVLHDGRADVVVTRVEADPPR